MNDSQKDAPEEEISTPGTVLFTLVVAMMIFGFWALMFRTLMVRG